MKRCGKNIKQRLISALVCAVVAFTAFQLAAPTRALTLINYGDYKLAMMGDDEYLVYSYSGSSTDITLPHSANGVPVTGIYGNCFENSSLTSVKIPSNYTFIGSYAFFNSRSLRTVNISGVVDEIGKYVFSGCTALTGIDLSGCAGLAEIPEGAFSGDTSLASLTISPYVSEIGDYAFKGTALTSLSMTDKVVKIGNGAFRDCAQLSDVQLSLSLRTIGERAFENDSALTSVYIPSSVSSIGLAAFAPMSYQSKIEVRYPSGSYAESYCAGNNVVYAVASLMGDANLDGYVNVMDATLIQKHEVGLRAITDTEARENADVNYDGELGIRDATLIQMYAVREILSF